MTRSIISTEKKIGRGRPRTDPVAQHFTMRRELSAALDAWIAAQPEPKPTRPEAIRRLLERALEGERPEKTLDQKIATAKDSIKRNPDAGEQTPANGMAALRRGLAETKLRSLKSRKRTTKNIAEGD